MPKTFRNLWPQIAGFEPLLAAYRAARRGKRGTRQVARFELRCEEHLLRLQQELESGRYRPGPYHSFVVYEPKRRVISAAPFRDRVVHHALCRAIEPIWEARFIHHSYACRSGKGTHRALDAAQHLIRGHRYVLRCDVEQFFPSVDHRVLFGQFARHIGDVRTLDLIERILEGGQDVLRAEYRQVYFPGDDLFAALRLRGLPIGNLTSQFWANVMLHDLDMFAARAALPRLRALLRRLHALRRRSDDAAALARGDHRAAGRAAAHHARDAGAGRGDGGGRAVPRLDALPRPAAAAQAQRGPLPQALAAPLRGVRRREGRPRAAHGQCAGLGGARGPRQHTRAAAERAGADHPARGAVSESPIFVRTHDLLLWLIPAVGRLPRSQRPVLGRAVQEAALALQQHLTSAALGSEPLEDLRRADVALALLRARLRLCYELRLISVGQYKHVAGQIAEVGRLLGGWLRRVQQTAAP
jgi:hypothetical protein